MNLAEKGPTEEKELKRCLTQGAWPNPGFNELEKTDCYSSLEGKVTPWLHPTTSHHLRSEHRRA